MKSGKIFILVPDGIGLRNFAYTSFVEIGKAKGWEIVFWNQTPFDLSALDFNEIKLEGKPRPFTDLFKRAKIIAELNYFSEKFNDGVYQSYKFNPVAHSFKARLKNGIVSFLVWYYNGEKGLEKLRNRLRSSERNSIYYKQCKMVLEREKPDMVFCTNQRPVAAISPLEAAKDLNISTATFIFSWDNLSKATMVVEADHYFVWSEIMKKELLCYYPHIESNRINVSGTPQFEHHFDPALIISRENFYKRHGLDLNREYICFSGDDITTSPDDPQYLEDVGAAINDLNLKGNNLGIIFRRCPVDLSDRYSMVLQKYSELIIEIAPSWKKLGGEWNTILPLKEDLALQVNTIHHSIGVINLGSTMVFDAVAQGKPCFYINYDVEEREDKTWSVEKIYKYVHFRSMTENAVIWINNNLEISSKIEKVLKEGSKQFLGDANRWFKTINQNSPEKASERIWEGIEKILK